jgi:hypothetical protein
MFESDYFGDFFGYESGDAPVRRHRVRVFAALTGQRRGRRGLWI